MLKNMPPEQVQRLKTRMMVAGQRGSLYPRDATYVLGELLGNAWNCRLDPALRFEKFPELKSFDMECLKDVVENYDVEIDKINKTWDQRMGELEKLMIAEADLHEKQTGRGSKGCVDSSRRKVVHGG